MAEMNYIKTSQKEYSSNDSDKTASRKFTFVEFSKKGLGRVNVCNSSHVDMSSARRIPPMQF